jgi:hypothetical protein
MHIVNLKFELLSPACSVTIGPDNRIIWVQFRRGWGAISLLASHPDPPTTQLARVALSPEFKLLGPDDDHLIPSSAEVKKDGAIPPLPNTSSVKLSDNSTY